MIDNVCPKCSQKKELKGIEGRLAKKLFMSQDERHVTTLGNFYLEKFLSNGSLEDLVEENEIDIDINWWNDFTRYYDGIFEEADGYVDDPEILMCKLTDAQTLKIEFHPGDIVYYVNDKQIACTGGHYKIQIFPFADLLKYMECQKDNRLFLLLLPLVIIGKEEVLYVTEIISSALEEVFDKSLCNQFAKCIVYGLIEE